jgi:hypothetical protein
MNKPTKEEWMQWHEENHMQAKTLIKMVQQLEQHTYIYIFAPPLKSRSLEIASQYATNEELKEEKQS